LLQRSDPNHQNVSTLVHELAHIKFSEVIERYASQLEGQNLKLFRKQNGRSSGTPTLLSYLNERFAWETEIRFRVELFRSSGWDFPQIFAPTLLALRAAPETLERAIRRNAHDIIVREYGQLGSEIRHWIDEPIHVALLRGKSAPGVSPRPAVTTALADQLDRRRLEWLSKQGVTPAELDALSPLSSHLLESTSLQRVARPLPVPDYLERTRGEIDRLDQYSEKIRAKAQRSKAPPHAPFAESAHELAALMGRSETLDDDLLDVFEMLIEPLENEGKWVIRPRGARGTPGHRPTRGQVLSAHPSIRSLLGPPELGLVSPREEALARHILNALDESEALQHVSSLPLQVADFERRSLREALAIADQMEDSLDVFRDALALVRTDPALWEWMALKKGNTVAGALFGPGIPPSERSQFLADWRRRAAGANAGS